MKKVLWTFWIALTIGIVGFYAYKMFVSDDKSVYLIGDPSHGHFQIELACTSCHTEAFGGPDLIQDACTSCHADELEAAHDSHPKKKFTDPRNADRIEILDARYCITCHTEHQKEQTHPMGVTLPTDYCYHCHKEVSEERESHKDLAFDSCASSGCHNYHDNRALYEDFLVEHANKPWLANDTTLPKRNAAKLTADTSDNHELLAFLNNESHSNKEVFDEWHNSAHAKVSCKACHSATSETESDWVKAPGIDACKTCHVKEAETFLQGKHGMRLASNLAAVTPSQSALPFSSKSANVAHGCSTCHSAHNYDTKHAATEACLFCHSDNHSAAFKSSPHASAEISDNELMSCATCHLPRTEESINGKKVVSVNHNQNENLRPNEKMIRPVCMQCHSLSFSIDALADKSLIESNFNGKPKNHIPSIDWSLERIKDSD